MIRSTHRIPSVDPSDEELDEFARELGAGSAKDIRDAHDK